MMQVGTHRVLFALGSVLLLFTSLGCGGNASGSGPVAGAGFQGGITPEVAGRDAAAAGAAGMAASSPAAGRAGMSVAEAGRNAVMAGTSAGPGSGGQGAAANGGSQGASTGALGQLADYLVKPRADRPQLDTQAFANVPLTRSDADKAKEMLWQDLAAWIQSSRMAEMGATESRAASLQVDGHTLRYYMAVRGTAPPSGRSLFISMHGGGNAGASTNDQQWNNQITLVDGYKPQNAIWIAPRAPSNEWNMWFTPDIEPLFERLITNLIVFEGIDPNKVYINGYSAGGDGVYQLGPRMADHWAGAAMSAGHPNDASALNLRNVPFAIHVGGDDTAYDRNLKAAEWGKMLESLRAADPGGYLNQWQVHAGLPHWMNMADAVAIPFVQQYARNPVPDRVVWRQANVTQPRFYWLALDQANRKQGTQVTATYSKGTVSLSAIQGLHKITICLSDAMMDLDQPVRIELSGRELFAGSVARTIGVVARTLEERGDPAMVFSGEVAVGLD
jgi:poly(3-hydroxybutyrate) depolymerase